MAGPGRNAPCPCGSGLKFKRCCDLGFTNEAARTAIRALGRAALERPEAESDRLWSSYYGPLGRAIGPARDDDDFFADWMYFDARDSGGERLVDIVLRSSRLSQGERTFLSMMRGTAWRLYEFAACPPPLVKLREILSGEEVLVNHKSLDPPTESTCLILARVIPRGASGWPELVGARFEFPGALRDELVSRLSSAIASFRTAHPQAAAEEAYKASALALHYLWSPVVRAPPALPGPNEALREAAELRLQNQYDGWIDRPLNDLEGQTPRVAVGVAVLRPRLVDTPSDSPNACWHALTVASPTSASEF